ncbi:MULTISPECIES: WG repeat-containing protein [unclassified Lysobacter]|uniref:WG repeat-containing protein n=1 Tax=unclassified Lysobacter TaxID=2635362 RepID=UPI00138F392B|nr:MULTISPECIES: WG repeat-containing protein [unclassified Lysobacter]
MARIASVVLLCLLAACAPVRFYQAMTGKESPEPEPVSISERGKRAPSHRKVASLGGGLYLARIDRKGRSAFGVVDQRNLVVIPIGYQHIADLGDEGLRAIGLQSVRKFDRQGNELSATLFARELHFVNGQAVAITKPSDGDFRDDRYGVIGQDGSTVIPFEYLNIVEVSTKLRPDVSWYQVQRDVAKPGEPRKVRRGLLDARGRVVLPSEYYEVSPGYALDGLDNGWARVSEQEHKSITVNFITGLRMQRPGGSYYGRTVGYSTLLNPEPETLNPYEKIQWRKDHDERYRLELFDMYGKLVYDQGDIGDTWDLSGLTAVWRANKIALLDADGRPLTDFKYDEIKDYGGGQALMTSSGRTVCIDAADPPGTERAARDCAKAATRKDAGKRERRQRGPMAVPAGYPRYGG